MEGEPRWLKSKLGKGSASTDVGGGKKEGQGKQEAKPLPTSTLQHSFQGWKVPPGTAGRAPRRHLSTCSRQQPRGDRRQEVPHTWAHKSQKLLCIVPERGITNQVTPSTYCHQDQAAAELVSGRLWLGGSTPQPHARRLPLCQNPALLLKGTSQRVPMWHPRHDQMSTQTPALQSNPPAHLCCGFFGCLFVFPKWALAGCYIHKGYNYQSVVLGLLGAGGGTKCFSLMKGKIFPEQFHIAMLSVSGT